MRATGIVRQVDRLGRIVIPMEIRKKFDMVDVKGEIKDVL